MRTRLQPGETVALIVRKHWLVLLKPALFLLAVLLYLPFRHVKILGFEALLNYLLPYAVALSGALFLYCYLDRRVNMWAVTSSRLIDEYGVFTHKSKENPLDKINDIVAEQTVLGRIFGYGSISVQTAATAGETVIEFVEKPQQLKQTINAQKAMRAERQEVPDFLEGDRQKHGGSFQTVLLHESVRPPFSLRCPHCGWDIAIEYAGKPRIEHPDSSTESVEDRHDQAENNASVVLPPERGDHQPSTTEGTGSTATGAKAAADPFNWKKRSR